MNWQYVIFFLVIGTLMVQAFRYLLWYFNEEAKCQLRQDADDLRELLREADDLIAEIVDPEPCSIIGGVCYAHHQASVKGCPQARAKALIGWSEPIIRVRPQTPPAFTDNAEG